jgi:hypothetical protein
MTKMNINGGTCLSSGRAPTRQRDRLIERAIPGHDATPRQNRDSSLRRPIRSGGSLSENIRARLGELHIDARYMPDQPAVADRALNLMEAELLKRHIVHAETRGRSETIRVAATDSYKEHGATEWFLHQQHGCYLRDHARRERRLPPAEMGGFPGRRTSAII